MRRATLIGLALTFLVALAPVAVQADGGDEERPFGFDVGHLSPETRDKVDRVAEHLLEHPDLLGRVIDYVSQRWPHLLPEAGRTPPVAPPPPQPDPSPGPEPRVDICHVTNGNFELISVPESAVDAHMAHGDVLPGDSVPDTAARRYDPDCQERFSLLGLRVDGCVAAVDLAETCEPEFEGNPPPTAGLFAEPLPGWVAVEDPGVEFSSAEGIQADFSGDFGIADVGGSEQQSAGSLTLTVPAGQPALSFYLVAPDWIGDYYIDDGGSLDVTSTMSSGIYGFLIQTAPTVGATEAQTVTFQIVAQEDDALVPELFD